MGRRETREAAVRFLFSRDFTERENAELNEETVRSFVDEFEEKAPEKVDAGYVLAVAKGVAGNLPRINELIYSHTDNWQPERMARMDLAILRVAVYEMLFEEDIPDSVSINEAVELAKKYSHDDAGTFINGILGGIYRSLKNK